MSFSRVLQGRLLVIAFLSVAVIGGAVAVVDGGHLVHASAAKATTTATAGKHKNHCPGLSLAQQLAAQFSLSTTSTSEDMQAICSLHQGTFKGTTPGGVSVSSHRVFGYGEIADLLTYAQFLATHDNATLTSDNPRSYLAEALQRCGTTPLETCLKATVPGTAGSSGNGQGKPSGKSHH